MAEELSRPPSGKLRVAISRASDYFGREPRQRDRDRLFEPR